MPLYRASGSLVGAQFTGQTKKFGPIALVKREYSVADQPIRGVMRTLLTLIACALLLAGCSKHAAPAGRWEGTYESGDTFVAARLEISDGLVRVSAPDVTDDGLRDESERAQMRANMAARLAGAWGEIEPRKMDFDGTTFRKPGGIAPQISWDPETKVMTLWVYLGTNPAIKIPLRPVSAFSDDPWTH